MELARNNHPSVRQFIAMARFIRLNADFSPFFIFVSFSEKAMITPDFRLPSSDFRLPTPAYQQMCESCNPF